MYRWSAQLSLTLVCFLLGALLVTQFRTQSRIVKSILAASSTEQTTLISSLYDSNLVLRQEVEGLSAQLEEHQRSLGQVDMDSLVKELNQLRLVNGLSEVSGSGVEMVIGAEVKAQDLLDLVNELRNAGAEALAINNLRLSGLSAILADKGQVFVDDTPVASPYTLRAIGHADTLERALLRKGGLMSYLESTYPGATIRVKKAPKLVLPFYKGGYTFRYAKPAQ